MSGKTYDFSEEYLKSFISSEIIINEIKKRYRVRKVNKVTLKHVLYEGARINNILRMNEYWYEKMVETLNLNLEGDEILDKEDFCIYNTSEAEVSCIYVINNTYYNN